MATKQERASVYPAGGETTLTLDDLAPGEEYKVNLRVRNTDGDHSDDPWSGPWTPTAATRVREDPPASFARPGRPA